MNFLLSLRQWAGYMLVSPMLVACGGGGGSSGADTLPANEPPMAAFTAIPNSGAAPLEVEFDASASSDPDGAITAYDWTFGNGQSAQGAHVRASYAQAGTYTVRLVVTDAEGADTSSTRDVTVTAQQALSVAGSVRIQAGSDVDVDTNDPSTRDGDNDTLSSARQVGNPANIGGYLARSGTGEPGLLRSRGDVHDYYRFNAVGDETVLLTIGDARSVNDLDLYLYDGSGELLDSSLGTRRTEALPVRAPGGYIVEVRAFRGASNYVLAIGQNQRPDLRALRMSAAFVPGEVVVGPARKGRATAPAGTLHPEGLTMLARASAANAPCLMRLPRTNHRQTRMAALDTTPLRVPGPRPAPETLTRLDTLHAIKLLRRQGRYAYVEPNYRRRAHRTPNEDFFDRQWHYDTIKLPQAWEITTGSEDVVVAVIDTGVLVDHPDLQPQLTPGYDFVSDPARALDGDGLDADPNDPGDQAVTNSSSFHGTHVAGTVAAETDNGIGVAGTGWHTRVMPVRALGQGGATSFDLIEAVRFAAGLDNASGQVPEAAADVINLSLGGGGFSRAEQAAYQAARGQGSIIIASAGNEANAKVDFPAAYEGVIGVSATNIRNQLADYSNTGERVDVAAPGGELSTDVNGDGVADGVLSTLGDDSDTAPDREPELVYGLLAGTSMAAPHVAGVAALMRAEDPGLTPAKFDALLASGALTDDLGTPGRDARFGHGLINAQKAVVAAGGDALDAFIVASPGNLNFGAFAEQLDITVDNAGTTPATITEVSDDAPWLEVTERDVDAATQAGTYTVSVERAGLGNGVYGAEITFASSANEVTLSVVMQVRSLDASADAGFHFIVLVDADNQVVAQDSARAADGSYSFRLEDVPEGDYTLAAGTDSDNDGQLCDSGEACGIYRTLDAPTLLRVDADLNDLEFVTGFRAGLFSSGASSNHAAQTPVAPIPLRATRDKELAP